MHRPMLKGPTRRAKPHKKCGRPQDSHAPEALRLPPHFVNAVFCTVLSPWSLINALVIKIPDFYFQSAP